MSEVDTLLAELRDGSEHTADGSFSLDRERAREKMRQFQLADPHRWIVLLVRAALLRGAAHVGVTIDETSIAVTFDGPPLSRADFEELYASMFSRSLVPEIRARRDLALALNAVMALQPEAVRVVTGDAAAGLRFELQQGMADRVEPSPNGPGGTRVRVIFGARSPTLVALRTRGQQSPEQRLLTAACKWSEAAISFEGRPISLGMAALDVAGAWRLSAPRSGRCGFSPAGETASLTVLQYGVVLTTRRLADLPQGFVALVDGSTLLTDVSHSEPVEDEAWTALVADVRAAADRSLAALAREIAARGDLPHHDNGTPRWQWGMLRSQLVARGVSASPPTEVIDALLDLPLWRRASGDAATTRALLRAQEAGFTTTYDPAQIPAVLRDTIVTDEAGARALTSVLPFAVDRDRLVKTLIEQAAVRARPLPPDAAVPDSPATPARAPRPRKAPPAPKGDPRRAKFLQRPQLFTVQRPRLAVGPIEVEHDGVRCTLGVTESSLVGGTHELSRVRVLVERRLLTELKVVCPLPGVDATVAADDLRANPTWNGLADDASRSRVHAALAAGIRGVVASLAGVDAEPSSIARVVLGATLGAMLVDPLLLRVWQALADAPRGLFARVVAVIEAKGLEVLRDRLEAALAQRDAARDLEALVDGAPTTARGSLRVMLADELAALAGVPLFGEPARSLVALASEPQPDTGLVGRERDLVRRLTGKAAVVEVAMPIAVATRQGDATASRAAPGREPSAAPREVATHASTIAAAASASIDPAPTRAASVAEIDATPPRTASDGDVAPPVATLPVEPASTLAEPLASTASMPAEPLAATDEAPPDVPEVPSRALVDAVRAELHAIAQLDARVPVDARFDTILARPGDGLAIAIADDGGVTLDTSHAVVAAAIRTADPRLSTLVASAVYTAVNTWYAAVTDDHEAWFIAAHARHAVRRSGV